MKEMTNINKEVTESLKQSVLAMDNSTRLVFQSLQEEKIFRKILTLKFKCLRFGSLSIQKLNFLQKRNFPKRERDLDLIMIIKEDENCQ